MTGKDGRAQMRSALPTATPAERARRDRRLSRPQPSVPLICAHRFFYGINPPKPNDEVWCTKCGLPSVVAG